MAFFGIGKKKEDEPSAAPPPSGLPVDQILTLKQQGMPDEQIIKQLQDQGFNSSQIFDAMSQVSMNQQAPMTGAPIESPYPEAQPQQYQEPQPQEQPTFMPENAPSGITERERVEELAEAIIDEKWNELVKDINRVIEWKEITEARMNKIDQKLADLTTGLESLHRSLMAKISDYDKNISNVGVEIKAMEKVFQKILPTLTENVNKLERMGKSSSKK